MTIPAYPLAWPAGWKRTTHRAEARFSTKSAAHDRELFAGWERHERTALADGARERTEVVWLNPACSAALARRTAQQELIA